MRLQLLEIIKPIQKIMQRLGNPEPKISSQFTNDARKLIKTGDIVLSRENYKLTNLFVPKYWGHAAIYKQGQMIEAVGDYILNKKKLNGVRSEDFYRWFYQKDSIAILRPKFGNEYINQLAAHEASLLIGMPYDYGFSTNTNAFYCSELCTFAYDKAMKEFKLESPLKARKQFGVVTTTPQDLYNHQNFEIILEERN